MKSIKTAIIGVGYRGQILLNLLSKIRSFNIIAIADPILPEDIQNKYHCYSNGADDYKNMINKHVPDLVIIASPWTCHIEQAMYAISKGCNVALEIKGGLSKGEYEPLIQQANKSNVRIYPLENTVFMREHMAVLNMVNCGIFGKIVAVKGGYRHDLRKLLINEKGEIGKTGNSEGIWRSGFYKEKNCDIYPTHGLAPIYLFAGIGRHDKVTKLTSFSSKACGMAEYIKSKNGDSSVKISMGDIIITQMKTEKGTILTLTHDTTLPRPKTFDIEIQGSKGIWRGEFRQIYIEGKSPYEKWEDDSKYISKYDHKFWKKWRKVAETTDTHHKGMDYIMLKAIAEDMKGNESYPVNIQDLAFWTSITNLSMESIEKGTTLNL